MKTVSLSHAKTHLTHLIERVAAGEEILITKRGKVVAKIVSAAPRVSVAEIRAFHQKIYTQDLFSTGAKWRSSK